MKKIMCIMLVALLLLGMMPVQPVKASTEAFVWHEVSDELEMWEDGSAFYIRYGDLSYTVPVYYHDEGATNYLVTALEYSYPDNEDNHSILIKVHMTSRYYYVDMYETQYHNDGDYVTPYFPIYESCSKNEYYQHWQVVIADGAITGSFLDGGYHSNYNDSNVDNLYTTAYYGGKYRIYATPNTLRAKEGESVTTLTAMPLTYNVLPGSPNEDAEGIYKTVFRMLTDGATVYNTYYYNNSYLSGADTISCTGTNGQIRVDATKLADGTTTRATQSNPALMCQISSYGTAYDIAYTNDENLCSLLGIEIPEEKTWNVDQQAWLLSDGTVDGTTDDSTDDSSGGLDVGVDVPTGGATDNDDTTNDSDYDTNIRLSSPVLNMVGENAIVSADIYNGFYKDSVSESVWGLGLSLNWNYSPDALFVDGMPCVKIELVGNFETEDGVFESYSCVLFDYVVNPASKADYVRLLWGDCAFSFHRISQLFAEFGIDDFANQCEEIQFKLTPYYYDNNGVLHRSYTINAEYMVRDCIAQYTGSNWESDDDAANGSEDYVGDSIFDIIANLPEYVEDLWDGLSSLANGVGNIPQLLGDLFPFLPSGIITLMCTGLVACVVIGLIRWIRG